MCSRGLCFPSTWALQLEFLCVDELYNLIEDLILILLHSRLSANAIGAMCNPSFSQWQQLWKHHLSEIHTPLCLPLLISSPLSNHLLIPVCHRSRISARNSRVFADRIESPVVLPCLPKESLDGSDGPCEQVSCSCRTYLPPDIELGSTWSKSTSLTVRFKIGSLDSSNYCQLILNRHPSLLELWWRGLYPGFLIFSRMLCWAPYNECYAVPISFPHSSLHWHWPSHHCPSRH